MDGLPEVRFADGFDAPEPLALGLTATQLGAAAIGAVLGYLLLRTPLPGWLSVPLAVACWLVTAVVVLVRVDGRPVVDWAGVATRYVTTQRETEPLLIEAENDPEPAGDGSSGSPPNAADHVAPPSAPAAMDPPEQPWMRWLREDGDEGLAEEASPARVPAPPVETERRVPVVLLPTPARSDASSAAPAAAGPEGEEDEDDPECGYTEDEEPAVVVPLRAPATLEVEDTDNVEGDSPGDPVPAAVPVFVGATRRIVFFSLNGGSGRTTLALETAAVLAARGRHTSPAGASVPLRVALLEMDLRSPTVSVRIGVPQPTVWDWVMSGNADASHLDDYVVTHSTGLRLLLGPPKPAASGSPTVDPAQVADVVHELERQGTQFIVFDVAADLNDTTRWVLNAAHDVFVVITPTASGVQDAYRSTELLRRMGLRHKLAYVVNRTRGGLDLSEAMGDLNGRIVAEIPFDTRVEEAENAHRLVTAADGPAATGLRRLASHIYPGIAPAGSRRRLPWRLFRAG